MAVEKIVTLCKEGDSTTEYYPNIKGDNIPSNAVAKGKLTQELQDEIDGKAPQSTTYTKTETNALLDLKADKSTTYTKTETDTLLNGKANSNDVYTKTATDTLLNGKQNKLYIHYINCTLKTSGNEYINHLTITIINDVQTAFTWNLLKQYLTTIFEDDDAEILASGVYNTTNQITAIGYSASEGCVILRYGENILLDNDEEFTSTYFLDKVISL